MGSVVLPPPVKPLAGLLAGEPAMLAAARSCLHAKFGDEAMVSEPQMFQHTAYYDSEMGPGLLRQFVVMDELHRPEELAEWKMLAQRWEQALGANARGGRKVNIDPGYLAPGKLVLASTKDHGHRMYLQQGIYAEITLRIRGNQFRAWEWTYPDYAQAAPFFTQAYGLYKNQLQALAANHQP